MLHMAKGCSALLITLTLIALQATPTVAGDKVAASSAAAQQMLQRFQNSHDIGDLSSAVDAMTAATDIDSLTAQTFVSKRRAIVGEWANIIKTIDDAYDPTFDPKTRFGCPLPPAENGTTLPPCADPSLIQNSNARAEYAAKLAEFKHLNAQATRYWAIRSVDDRAMTVLQMTLDLLRNVAPDGASADFNALDNILQHAGLSAARRTAIDTMLYPPPARS